MRVACRGESCDRGQAVVLALVVATVLFVAVLVAAGVMGTRVAQRARAQAAADAVALAAVIGGDAAARQVAAANDAVVVSLSFDAATRSATVVVRVGEASATARATDAP